MLIGNELEDILVDFESKVKLAGFTQPKTAQIQPVESLIKN